MAALLALRRLRLDAVWWLASPGNPLKSRRPAELESRLAAAAACADNPRIAVTGIEAALGTRYTADLLARLAPQLESLVPVWIMGADNLVGFHRWRDWRRIAATLPMAIVDRPGFTLAALATPAARALSRFRIAETAAATLPLRAPPAWVFLHGPRLGISSTLLRLGERP